MIIDLIQSGENANQNTIQAASSSSSTAAGPSTTSKSFSAPSYYTSSAVPKACPSTLTSSATDLTPKPTHGKTEVLGHQNKLFPTGSGVYFESKNLGNEEATTSMHNNNTASYWF